MGVLSPSGSLGLQFVCLWSGSDCGRSECFSGQIDSPRRDFNPVGLFSVYFLRDSWEGFRPLYLSTTQDGLRIGKVGRFWEGWQRQSSGWWCSSTIRSSTSPDCQAEILDDGLVERYRQGHGAHWDLHVCQVSWNLSSTQ